MSAIVEIGLFRSEWRMSKNLLKRVVFLFDVDGTLTKSRNVWLLASA